MGAPVLFALLVALAPAAAQKTDTRTEPREEIALAAAAGAFSATVLWHADEIVYVETDARERAAVVDAFVPWGRSRIRVRDGFDARAVRAVEAQRF